LGCAGHLLSSDRQVNQDDDQELKGWARSIDSLFAEAGDAESIGLDSAEGPEEGHEHRPDVEPEPEEPDLTFGFDEPEPEPILQFGGHPEPVEPEAVEPFDEPDVVEVDPVPEVDQGPVSEAVDPDASEEEPRSPAELKLDEAVSAYLMATSDQRPDLADALRVVVEEAREANALHGLAGTMDALLVQPVPDPEAEALAEELMNAATQMTMALRLGSLREERERADLVHAYAKLGDPMASAIADALTETDDRLARKTYVSALVALGQSGLRVVEVMLDDSRWFVARNGIAVLGEVGGETTVGHLTGTLAHEDPRVRRETVLSLAKIGGEDASLLVVGMLNDSDPKVRASAARAASVLKVERAHKPLMNILDEGDEDTVIEQVIRALGQLGDPSAVPLIKKKAVASFFSKPPMEIRLAALSALGAIGTPHAMSLVEATEADKDPKIRAVVQQILAAR